MHSVVCPSPTHDERSEPVNDPESPASATRALLRRTARRVTLYAALAAGALVLVAVTAPGAVPLMSAALVIGLFLVALQVWREVRLFRPGEGAADNRGDPSGGVLGAAVTEAHAAQLDSQRVRNEAAYDLYMRARHAWGRRTAASLQQGITLLHQALVRDPHFVLAEVALADSYIMQGVYGMRAPQDVMPLACAAAERALAQDAARVEALTARACIAAVYEWDWDAAESGFRRALEINSEYAAAHLWLAMNVLIPQGRFTEAATKLHAALELHPRAPWIRTSLGVLLYYQRDFDAATTVLQQVSAADPAFPLAHYFAGLSHHAAARHAHAVDLLRRARLTSRGSAEIEAAYAIALAGAGLDEEARAVLGALQQRARAGYVSPALVAQIHAALGELELAGEQLRAAASVRAADLIWIAVRPTYDALRSSDVYHEVGGLVLGSGAPVLQR